MVAIIKSGSSIRRPFQYNENKLETGAAVLLSIQNYPGNSAEQSAEMRLKYMLKLTQLNGRAKVNAVHISLNFAPGEVLDKDRLIRISKSYMMGIGFGDQPYLVYQHTDAGHPHLHLVTTNIQLDGTRIPLHNIGKLKSEPTRKAIENQFGLVPAEQQNKGEYLAKAVDISRVAYGKSETKRAIGNVLQHVLKNYRYTSLPELNAVLKGYNITADRGGEESRIFKNRGLVYRVLDEKGEKVGVPIKASSFHFMATLNDIESRFGANEIERKSHLPEIRSAVDLTFLKSKPTSLDEVVKSLERRGIAVVKRVNPDGRVYGLTYVDHRNRCVFNGSALGKKYSAKGMLERIGGGGNEKNSSQISMNPTTKSLGNQASDTHSLQKEGIEKSSGFRTYSLLVDLATPDAGFSHVPFEWKKRSRRKKKKL
ncbi:relaxase/mobilization nuclease domain-containing protein [Algoriphagus sp. A40]|uniref:relaxase/mobilization nuclease domain-containing protein n=1 Tax=Algoriphagus sp. A40 TaxID=1945863 RepID=UPI000986B3C3|nr:relaxase/mobilization nuclease domain-containing protein [Algoriphagus sp. A40]OOG76435.1 hypothetical protein B0E43_08060 [Algoriphagus sp. A40]